MPDRFSVMNPTESNVLTFNFANGLATGETLTGTPSVDVELDYGTDPNAAAIIKQNQISGSTVLLQVSGMLQDVDYHITVTCPTSNAAKVLAVAGILPCRDI